MQEQIEKFKEKWQNSQYQAVKQVLQSRVESFDGQRNQQSEALMSLKKSLQDFKNVPESERLKAVKPLVSSYLKEINNMRVYCNNLESVLSELYTQLEILPDPFPLFELIIQDEKENLVKMNHLQDKIKNQQKEINQLGGEVRDLQSKDRQSEYQIKQLGTKLQKYEIQVQELQFNIKDKHSIDQEQVLKQSGEIEKKIQILQQELEEVHFKNDQLNQDILMKQEMACKLLNSEKQEISNNEIMKLLEQRIEDYRVEIERLNNELDWEKKNKKNLQQKSLQQQQEEASTKQQMLALQKEYEDLKTELNEQQKLNITLKQDHDSEMKVIQQEYQKLQKETQSLGDQLQKYKSPQQDLSDFSQIKAQLQALQIKYKDLELQLQNEIKEKKSLQQSIEKLLQQQERKEEEISDLKLNIDKLESEVDLQIENNKDHIVQAIILQRERFRARSLELEKQNISLQKEVKNFEVEIENLRKYQYKGTEQDRKILGSIGSYNKINIRYFLIIYAMVLHLLVFIVLYNYSSCEKPQPFF